MIAISVHQLGKKFKLFTSQGGRFLDYVSAGRIKRHTDFWALQDISFEIPAGTTLGILGQNGSGKSTLLSILAGVLEQSSGSFEIRGKVSAILELGSGFHPEFSGRDNVYMYGSIMGLSKPEIDNRFNEIVRFSELGDFIDQPLRTYSSGMIVRLAFSVAVNVDADILIVDEALAVGDAIFQHRCFRKIREMQETGKTILYVGHDTEAVRNLCTQALLLDGGHIIERGDPNVVVNKYYALIAERERTYSEGNLIEHGKVPGEEYETVYDLVQHLSDARIESAERSSVQPHTVEIQSTPRRMIFAPPQSHISYSLSIGSGSSLSFAIGILPAAWEKIQHGVQFDIDVVVEDAKENIFSRTLRPKRNAGDRGWHNFCLPLEKFSGKTITVTFSTSGSGYDVSYCWSAWGWGKIVREFSRPYSDKMIPQSENGGIEVYPTSNDYLPIRYGNKKIEIINAVICDNEGNQKSNFISNERAIIKIRIECRSNVEHNVTVGFSIRNKYTVIYETNTWWLDNDLDNRKQGDLIDVEFLFPLNLGEGFYSVTPAVAIVHSDTSIEVLDRIEDWFMFQITNDIRMRGFVNLNARVSWKKNEDGL